MTDLPTGWEWTTLGEIADTSLGKMLDRGKPKRHNEVPYLRNLNVQWGRFDLSNISTMEIPQIDLERYRVKSGDLLVCEGGEVGRCAIWQKKDGYIAYQKALHRVRPFDRVDVRYLRYLLEHLSVTELLALSTGSTIKHLTQVQLKRIPVPLPPAAEQRRIVATLEDHLSRLDAGLTGIRMAKRKLKLFEKSTIELATDRDSNVWAEVRIGDIAQVSSGATPRKSRPEYYDGGHIPWITSAQLNDPFVRRAENYITERALKETSVKLLEPGTILVAMYGEGKTRGNCSELTFPATTNQACAAISIKPDYKRYKDWIKLVFDVNYERNRKLSAGGVQPNLNLGLIKNMRLHLPPDDDLTIRLEQVDEIRRAITRLNRELKHANNAARSFRSSLLAEAFGGRLVGQDPRDEPASVLLGRIRAERAARPKVTRGRRSKAAEPGQGSLL